MTTIKPQPDSRLAQLLAQYDMAKAEDAKAAEALKAIVDGIKAETLKCFDGLPGDVPNSIDIDTDGLCAKPLRLNFAESWRVDAKKLKAEALETYVRYAKASYSWTLRAI